MRVAFVGDKKGKVHYGRYKVFSDMFEDIDFKFFEAKNAKLPRLAKKYDALYFASFTLLKKSKIKHPMILGSVTSWKCVRENRDLSLLKRFNKISVNNHGLWKVIRKTRRDAVYMPNGVDSEFFTPEPSKFDSGNIRIGWAGNKDRQEKGYDIWASLKPSLSSSFRTSEVATKKSDPAKKMLSASEMRQFYRSLDFYIVTSRFEGTPNPALEAASCGVPVVSTRVGNMPELIVEGRNGFFMECNTGSMADTMAKLTQISALQYKLMSHHIRSDICQNWSWSHRKGVILDFFRIECDI